MEGPCLNVYVSSGLSSFLSPALRYYLSVLLPVFGGGCSPRALRACVRGFLRAVLEWTGRSARFIQRCGGGAAGRDVTAAEAPPGSQSGERIALPPPSTPTPTPPDRKESSSSVDAGVEQPI